MFRNTGANAFAKNQMRLAYEDKRDLYCMHLTDLIIDDDPDVIAVTETWFDNSIGESEFTPDGFTTFRKDRNTNNYNPGTYTQNDRGGVLLLIKKTLMLMQK